MSRPFALVARGVNCVVMRFVLAGGGAMVGGGASNVGILQGFEVIPLDELIAGALYIELVGWL